MIRCLVLLAFLGAAPLGGSAAAASEERPLVNPCFVIRQWRSDAPARLRIYGKARAPGRDFRQGIVRDTDGTRTMVIWIKLASDETVAFEVAR